MNDVPSSGNAPVFVFSSVLQPFLIKHKNMRLSDLICLEKNNIPQTIAVELSKKVFKTNTIDKIGVIKGQLDINKKER